MYLGRKIGSFTAEDSGILAPGLQLPEASATEAPKELKVASVVSEVALGEVAAAPVSAGERERLWGLIGHLRKANTRLFRANRRLTKEAEALRAERVADGALTVESIVAAAPVSSSSRETVKS